MDTDGTPNGYERPRLRAVGRPLGSALGAQGCSVRP